MGNLMFLHWKGVGFYARKADGHEIHWICNSNINNAEGLAKLAGLDAKSVAYLDRKPEDSEFISVIEEKKK